MRLSISSSLPIFRQHFWILSRCFAEKIILLLQDLMLMARWSGRAMIQQMQIPYKQEGNSGSDGRARSSETRTWELMPRQKSRRHYWIHWHSARLTQSRLLRRRCAQWIDKFHMSWSKVVGMSNKDETWKTNNVHMVLNGKLATSEIATMSIKKGSMN